MLGGAGGRYGASALVTADLAGYPAMELVEVVCCCESRERGSGHGVLLVVVGLWWKLRVCQLGVFGCGCYDGHCGC